MSIPDVVRHGKNSSSVEEKLDDLVVVGVSGQDDWGNVGCEAGSLTLSKRLPALQLQVLVVCVLFLHTVWRVLFVLFQFWFYFIYLFVLWLALLTPDGTQCSSD